MSKKKIISLKDFLKIYTAIDDKFIDEYYKFYELCDNNVFGILLDDVIKYLKINKREKFYSRFRQNYTINKDYIIQTHNRKKEKGVAINEYYITLDTFEKICMLSKSSKANKIRDYFIILRKFIQYYKDNISHMIINSSMKNKSSCVYIILADKNKDIFKFGRTSDIRSRLRNYASGKSTHPDVKFIILVKDKIFVENCVKSLISDYRYKPHKEIYRVDIGMLKQSILECASLDIKFDKKYNNKNINAYIVFDDIKNNKTKSKSISKSISKSMSKSMSKSRSKPKSKTRPKSMSKSKSKSRSKTKSKMGPKSSSKSKSKTRTTTKRR